MAMRPQDPVSRDGRAEARIFGRFYRASSALENPIPGTGLGLVITRAIIECHRGTIALSQHQGAGTTFLIVLPTKALPEPA